MNRKTIQIIIAVVATVALSVPLYIIILYTTPIEPQSLQCDLNIVVSPEGDIGCVTGETALALSLLDGWNAPEGYYERALERTAMYEQELISLGLPLGPLSEVTYYSKKDVAASYVWVEHTYHRDDGNSPWDGAEQTKPDCFDANGVDLVVEMTFSVPFIIESCDACGCHDGTGLFLIKMPEDGRIPHFISHKHAQ